jgi:hypothetical protein
LGLRCGKRNPTAFVVSAKSYFAKNEYEAGIIQLKSAADSTRQCRGANLYGKALLDTGRPAAAETEIRKAIEL